MTGWVGILNSFLFTLLTAGSLIREDGFYVLCAASAEETALHTVGKINGGINNLHQVERQVSEGRYAGDNIVAQNSSQILSLKIVC